jgi:transcriptional regulator with XRE-family HTH domain
MGVQFNNKRVMELQASNLITQEAISKVIGIVPQQYRKKISGKVDFKASEICKLADFFKVDPSIFFTIAVDK